jgi:DNA-directed RNA polymerase subunit alpha
LRWVAWEGKDNHPQVGSIAVVDFFGMQILPILSHSERGGNPMTTTRIPLSPADQQTHSLEDRLEMSTAEIGLSVRTTNCLEDRGIFTVSDLLNCTPKELLSISNFGDKTLEEVYKALESVGFFRKSEAVAV